MGKVKDWVIEMEEDASYMTRQEFMDKHGETVVEYYDELQLKWQYDHAEPGEPDDIGTMTKSLTNDKRQKHLTNDKRTTLTIARLSQVFKDFDN